MTRARPQRKCERRRAGDGDDAEAVALAQRDVDDAGGETARGIEFRKIGPREIGLPHRRGRIEQKP
jgi:hypothetical protein